VGGLLWWLATLLPLLDYRHRTADAPLMISRRHLAPLLISAAYGLAAGIVAGSWVVGVLPVIQVLMLLNWPPGVRARVVLTATALLVALAVIDLRVIHPEGSGTTWFQLAFFSVVLPAVTVSSLWWWDVLVTLDRARASEAKLAATQERLRLATDVHDLQGHHLQVIALQLELAERLMPRDPQAGMEQLRAARGSVDGARQGTRDLATRFRSVPLRDELANAVDLLRAAGTKAEAMVDPEASLAPASALGPVIRETTTNVLRHGAGGWARLSLTRADGSWRYEIANDAADLVPEGTGGGAGLEGIARRAAEAGGDVEVRREGETFTVVVTVPATGEDAG
jgi:two-component system sensor histidine kinase DesK